MQMQFMRPLSGAETRSCRTCSASADEASPACREAACGHRYASGISLLRLLAVTFEPMEALI